jgi:hypothetical protein
MIIALMTLGAMLIVATQRAAAQHHEPTTHVATATRASHLPADDPEFDYANGLSKAFRNASGSVLPSVVTIQRTAVVEPLAKSSRDENLTMNDDGDK